MATTMTGVVAEVVAVLAVEAVAEDVMVAVVAAAVEAVTVVVAEEAADSASESSEAICNLLLLRALELSSDAGRRRNVARPMREEVLAAVLPDDHRICCR